MSGSGRGGSGRGNNRRRPFRRRDTDPRQEESSRGEGTFARESGTLSKNSAPQKNNASSLKGAAGQRAPESTGRQSRGGRAGRGGEDFRVEKSFFFDRPKWTAPKINTDPLPVPTCPWCDKPIRDMSSALADKDSGEAVHFDCVMERLAAGENLEKGETLSYIGGGRFGILSFSSPPPRRESRGRAGSSAEPEHTRAVGRPFLPEGRNFKIKRIIEWENKDKRAEWRSLICDHYSVT